MPRQQKTASLALMKAVIEQAAELNRGLSMLYFLSTY